VNLRTLGIEPGYRSALGEWNQANEASLHAVEQAMSPKTRDPSAFVDVWVLGSGATRALTEPSELRLEDGSVSEVAGYLSRELPIGYHELIGRESGLRTRVIITPERCFLPDDLFTWGWAVQLYAVRSEKSWGMGDLGDLRRLARWSSRDLKAGMMLINPLHAAFPAGPQQPSPYYPSSRLFRNPLYIAVEQVDGAQKLPELRELTAAGQALSKGKRIDRNAVFALKMQALEKIFAAFRASPAFDAYIEKEAPLLEMYATFAVLAEQHGNNWRQWPLQFRGAHDPAVAEFRSAHLERVRFHEWLQWVIDEQLAAAGREIPLVGDLAVGIDPGGADAWLWNDLFAEGMEVGAPPDEFNTLGQKWGLLPFNPVRLRTAGYEPFIRIVRACVRHMGGFRLDHVMGLFRLFWIPSGKGAKEGVYVRYPALDLLGIVALESMRAQAYVVGEDLGTVEDDVRRELSFRRLLSYRVLWFESGDPSTYPREAVATVTTHDLPTIAGLWTGADLEVQRSLNLSPNEKGTIEQQKTLAKLTGSKKNTPVDEVVLRTHAALARAPSRLVTAVIDDALSVPERPNMPGTIDEYPSWCIPLPRTLEQIEKDPRPRRIAKVLGARKAPKLVKTPKPVKLAAPAKKKPAKRAAALLGKRASQPRVNPPNKAKTTTRTSARGGKRR